jgi:hypothetical protein
MRAALKILGTFALMVASGVVAFGAAVAFLMNLGLKHHDNYEYYSRFPGTLFIFGCASIGFIAPAALVWYLDRNSWRVRLRDFFIAMFLVAVVLGIYTLSW